MSKFLVCDGNLVDATSGGRPVIPSVKGCDTGWVEVTYDSNALLTQLTALNTFDADQAAKDVGFCLLIFIIGFIIGVVIRNLRRL